MIALLVFGTLVGGLVLLRALQAVQACRVWLDDRDRGEPMQVVFTDGGRSVAGYKGQVGDCVVRSLAIVTGKPYADVYATVQQFCDDERPRKGQTRSNPRKGINPHTMYALMAHYGGQWVALSGKRPTHLREGEMPDKGRYVARLSRHVCAVIDGVVHDTYDPHRGGNRIVYGYWQFPELESK